MRHANHLPRTTLNKAVKDFRRQLNESISATGNNLSDTDWAMSNEIRQFTVYILFNTRLHICSPSFTPADNYWRDPAPLRHNVPISQLMKNSSLMWKIEISNRESFILVRSTLNFPVSPLPRLSWVEKWQSVMTSMNVIFYLLNIARGYIWKRTVCRSDRCAPNRRLVGPLQQPFAAKPCTHCPR
jgi:hypothetical protein